ncbi:MAG: beta-lactamase [Frankiales bacterium]|nr:beta-lactamase [Frankiales bacterium]
MSLPDALDRIAARLQPGEGLQVTVMGPDLTWSAARGTEAGGQFRIASVTKAFVACALLHQCQAGLLSLEQPVDPLLPSSLRLGDQTQLLHLLAHTSGLADHSSAPSYRSAVLAEPGRDWSRAEQVQIARELPQVGRPGETWHYSDTGYLLLGAVLETVSGSDLASAVRTWCELERLGLDQTWWEVLEPPRPGWRSPQHFLDLDLADVSPTIDLYGGGGLVSTTADLAAFGLALLGGELLDPPWLARMLRPGAPAQEGLGVFALPGGLWGHTGFWGTAMASTEDGAWSVALATTRTPGFGGTDPTPMPAELLA